MSIEREPSPTYNFPWQADAEGHYLIFRTEQGAFEARDTNTMMYLYPDMPEVDHVWIQVDEQQGFRLFREHVDIIGEGAFGALCDQLFEHDFQLSPEEEPQESDLAAFREAFGREPQRHNPIDRIVKLAMKNFEAEWKYLSGEPEWQPES